MSIGYDSLGGERVGLDAASIGGSVGNPLYTTVTSLPGSPAQDGTDATGVSQLAGGLGIRGWLSGIYKLLTGTLNVAIVSGASAFPVATNTAAVAAAAAAAAIKATAGRLYSITVTTSGSAQMTLTDGAGGTVLGVIPANAPPGEVFLSSSKPFATSLYANSGAGTPAIAVAYS